MENGDNEARDPSGFLSAIIGAPVTVKLNSGVVYKGVCLQKLRDAAGPNQFLPSYSPSQIPSSFEIEACLNRLVY
jgi:hypothetical protein